MAEAKETAKELEQIRKEVSAAGAADIIAGKVMIGDVVGSCCKSYPLSMNYVTMADMGLDQLNGSVVLCSAAMGDEQS